MAFFRKFFGVSDAAQESVGDTAVERETPPAESETAQPDSPAEAHTDVPAEAVEDRPWWSDGATLTEQSEQPGEISGNDSVAPATPEQPAEDRIPQEPHDTQLKPDTAPLPEMLDMEPASFINRDEPPMPFLRQGLAAAAMRDIGQVRSINQDSVFALVTTLPREGNDLPLGLFVVADGMGGHDGGEIASRMAISTVARHVLANLIMPALFDGTTEALQPLMVSAVQAANSAIWEHAQVIGSDMGTTCTAVLLLGHTLYIGHVGDSRLYLRQPDGLHLITNDHSAVGRLIEVGQLDPSEARDHPLRSQLYRTVGQHPNVQVDVVYQPVGNASHLLLCSDGLWGMVDESVLNDVLTRHVWPQNACRELIAHANEAGGDDNISAIVVTLPITQEEQE